MVLQRINKANLRDLITVTGLVILLKVDSNRRFVSPCDLEIWWMTLKNKRAPLLYYIKHFKSIGGFKQELQSANAQFREKIRNFWFHVTLKFDGWPWKTTGHLFYAMLSFMHHFKAIGKFKLQLQSENAQFGSKLAIFLSCVTLKFDGWPWKNKKAPLLCFFKLCASFHSHQWILIGVTVRRPPIWVKIDDFLAVWPWNLTDDLEKQ